MISTPVPAGTPHPAAVRLERQPAGVGELLDPVTRHPEHVRCTRAGETVGALHGAQLAGPAGWSTLGARPQPVTLGVAYLRPATESCGG